MNLLKVSGFVLVLIIPLLILLIVLDFNAFDKSFYQKEFAARAGKDADYLLLHNRVIEFITGKSGDVPAEFNDRETAHLVDVKDVVKNLTFLLYAMVALFVALLVVSGMMLKVRAAIMRFFGRVLIFGGMLSVFVALLFFIFVSYGFAETFDSFHRIFFEKGTYLFDPSSEMIVRIYPEELFINLGAIIARNFIIASILVAAIGFILLLVSKRKTINRR